MFYTQKSVMLNIFQQLNISSIWSLKERNFFFLHSNNTKAEETHSITNNSAHLLLKKTLDFKYFTLLIKHNQKMENVEKYFHAYYSHLI